MSVFDSNRDGVLDYQERMDQAEFQYADRNHDGALTRREFATIENPAKFNLYDTNHDGFVDAAEYAQGERMTEHRYGF